MEKYIEKLFDFKQIPTKILAVIWLCSSFILFANKVLVTKLNLQEFLKEYGKYIGISFVISSAFLLVATFVSISSKIRHRNFVKEIGKQIVADLQVLDFHEKALLREFYINGKQTLQLPMDNETVVGLTNKRIIYQTSSTGFTYLHGVFFFFSITEHASKHLTLKMIDLPPNPTQEEQMVLFDARPDWAKQKSQVDNRKSLRW